jgi:hypothetical protein
VTALCSSHSGSTVRSLLRRKASPESPPQSDG